MEPDLKGVRLAVLGGDAREVVLTSVLSRLGAKVQVWALPISSLSNVTICSSVSQALDGVKAIILPVPGINKDGTIYTSYSKEPVELTEKILSTVPAKTPIFVGFARKRLVDLAENCEMRLVELLKRNDVAILNSIPSAEGAVQMAMEATDITIHDSHTFVLGYGRNGATLARLLQGMGAKVTVFARKDEHLARIYEMGMRPLSYQQLPDAIGEANIIFNTVPGMVLPNSILIIMSSDTVIIDIASPPGGIDFEAAKRLGIKALQAPGLPGKVAPKTAGQILARVIPRLLAEELAL